MRYEQMVDAADIHFYTRHTNLVPDGTEVEAPASARQVETQDPMPRVKSWGGVSPNQEESERNKKDEYVLSPSTSIREEENIEEYAVKRGIAGTEKTTVAPGPSTTSCTYVTDNDKAKGRVNAPLASWQYKKADSMDSDKEYRQAGQNGYIKAHPEEGDAFGTSLGYTGNVHVGNVHEMQRICDYAFIYLDTLCKYVVIRYLQKER